MAAQGVRGYLSGDQRLFEVGSAHEHRAVRADDLRPAPEVHAVLVADAVAVDHVAGEHAGIEIVEAVPGLGAAQVLGFAGYAAAGTAGDAEDEVRPVGVDDAHRRRMPEVFTDQGPAAAEPRIECPQVLACGEVASLVEHAVGDEIHLAVDVVHLSRFQVHAAIVEALVGGLFHHAKQDAHAPAGCDERLQAWIVQAARRLRYQVFQEVAVEGELRKDEQVDGSRLRLGNCVQVLLDVALNVTQVRVDLRQAKT